MKDFLHIACVWLLYAAYFFPAVAGGDMYVVRDNLGYHFPTFAYIAGSLKHGYGIPSWFPTWGGLPLGAASVSLFPLAPHRMVAYALALLTDVGYVRAYTAGIGAGVLVFATGVWFLLKALTGSRPGATVGALMLAMGGTGLTVLHQEQVVATVFLAPWFALALAAARRDARFLPLAAALAGWMMTLHYPQIQMLAILFLVAACAASGLARPRDLRAWAGSPRMLALSALLFGLALLPVFYPYSLIDQLASPVRLSIGVGARTIGDYVKLNRQQESSATLEYVLHHLDPEPDSLMDAWLFYVTLTGMALATLGAFLAWRNRAARAPLVALGLFSWAALGVNWWLPQLLFLARFPFIGYFRQWYHFGPFVNLALAALGAFGAARIVEAARGAGGRRSALGAVVFAALVAMVAAEGVNYRGKYLGALAEPCPREPLIADGGDFLTILKKGRFGHALAERMGGTVGMPVMVYKEWSALPDACFPIHGEPPFTADHVFNDWGIEPGREWGILRKVCDATLSTFYVTARIPPSAGHDLPHMTHLATEGFAFDSRSFRPRRIVREEEYTVTPHAVRIEGSADARALVVAPYSYRLGFAGRINGEAARVYPVYAGAMAGMIAPPGAFTAEFRAPFGWYVYAVGVEYAAVAMAGLYAWGPWRRRRNEA
jgi:hypothetical protein